LLPFFMSMDGRYVSRSQGGGETMYRMYGMSQGAKEGGVTMYRMYGMSQGVREAV